MLLHYFELWGPPSYWRTRFDQFRDFVFNARSMKTIRSRRIGNSIVPRTRQLADYLRKYTRKLNQIFVRVKMSVVFKLIDSSLTRSVNCVFKCIREEFCNLDFYLYGI